MARMIQPQGVDDDVALVAMVVVVVDEVVLVVRGVVVVVVGALVVVVVGACVVVVAGALVVVVGALVVVVVGAVVVAVGWAAACGAMATQQLRRAQVAAHATKSPMRRLCPFSMIKA